MLGMTQGRLAEALGLSFQQVQKHEKAPHRHPGSLQRRRASSAGGVRVARTTFVLRNRARLAKRQRRIYRVLCRTHYREVHRASNEQNWWLPYSIDPLVIAGSHPVRI